VTRAIVIKMTARDTTYVRRERGRPQRRPHPKSRSNHLKQLAMSDVATMRAQRIDTAPRSDFTRCKRNHDTRDKKANMGEYGRKHKSALPQQQRPRNLGHADEQGRR
jgi:hypothetical protein